MHAGRVLITVVLALAATLAAAAAAAPKQPIEGVWAWTTVGSVKIVATGGGTFTGKVLTAWQDACGAVAKPGYSAWKIRGGGSRYTGTFAQFNSCKRAAVDGEASWTVKTRAGKTRLVFCMTKSGTPPGLTFNPPFCSELIAVGSTDSEAPVVKALRSDGTATGTVKLAYNVADDSGRTREQLTVRRGATEIFSRSIPLHSVQKDMKLSGGFFTRWVSPNVKGSFTFCVQAWDAAGNASATRCVPLAIR